LPIQKASDLAKGIGPVSHEPARLSADRRQYHASNNQNGTSGMLGRVSSGYGALKFFSIFRRPICSCAAPALSQDIEQQASEAATDSMAGLDLPGDRHGQWCRLHASGKSMVDQWRSSGMFPTACSLAVMPCCHRRMAAQSRLCTRQVSPPLSSVRRYGVEREGRVAWAPERAFAR